MPDTSHIDLSVVVPMFCEEANVEVLVSKVVAACRPLGIEWELILVDDGSTDRTVSLARAAAEASPEVVVVELARNFGQHAAVMAGFASARGRAIVTLDADMQNPPEEIPRIAALLDEGYDLVHTFRLEREDRWLRKAGSRWTNRMARALSGSRITDYGCMLRGYSRELALAVTRTNDRRTFIPALADRMAGRTTEIGVAHEARLAGESKYSFVKLLSLQLDLMTSLTVRPLRLLTVVGFGFATTGFAMGAVLLALRVVFGVTWANEGTLTVLGIVLIFCGAQFIAMGVLGEYLGRVHERVAGLPVYRVAQVTRSEQKRRSSSRESGLLSEESRVR